MTGVVYDSLKHARQKKEAVETYSSGLFIEIDIPGDVVVRADVKVEVSLSCHYHHHSLTTD